MHQSESWTCRSNYRIQRQSIVGRLSLQSRLFYTATHPPTLFPLQVSFVTFKLLLYYASQLEFQSFFLFHAPMINSLTLFYAQCHLDHLLNSSICKHCLQIYFCSSPRMRQYVRVSHFYEEAWCNYLCRSKRLCTLCSLISQNQHCWCLYKSWFTSNNHSGYQ